MKVRTTMQPDVEIDVDEIEYRGLERQGLLVDQTASTQAEQSLQTEKAHGVAPASATEKKEK